jgi:hypothetical protein
MDKYQMRRPLGECPEKFSPFDEHYVLRKVLLLELEDDSLH